MQPPLLCPLFHEPPPVGTSYLEAPSSASFEPFISPFPSSQVMNVEQDEDEHSIEMHLSYIARVMESRKGHFTVVPVLVGSLSHEKQVTTSSSWNPI